MSKPVICVFSSVEGGAPFWMCHDDRHRIQRVPDLRSLETAIDPSVGAQVHYAGVIFDRSLSAARFLGFLARIPVEFRGDVLWIDADGSGVLSTCALRDGRFLYRLDDDDVTFYLDARFDIAEGGVVRELAPPALRLTA